MWEFSVWCVGGYESSVRKKVCIKHLSIHCAPFCWQAKMNGLCSKFPMRHFFVAYSNFLSVRLYKMCSGWNLAPGIEFISFWNLGWSKILQSYRKGRKRGEREVKQNRKNTFLCFTYGVLFCVNLPFLKPVNYNLSLRVVCQHFYQATHHYHCVSQSLVVVTVMVPR